VADSCGSKEPCIRWVKDHPQKAAIRSLSAAVYAAKEIIQSSISIRCFSFFYYFYGLRSEINADDDDE